jgi:uncharacterized protein (DUF433 family)
MAATFVVFLNEASRYHSCLFAEIRDNAGMKESVYHSDPEIMHGEVVFVGTRVPVRSMFDHLEQGYTIDGFLYEFPSVKRGHCLAVLEESKQHTEEVALARAP